MAPWFFYPLKILLLIPAVCALCIAHSGESTAAAPYPQSTTIDSVTWDWATHDERAPGSDNWPVTWADDGNQYTSWGDGGGFGGTNTDGRVSLGVARIEGTADSYTGINVWGGENTSQPGEFDGKSYGILSVEGVLYQWIRQTDKVGGGKTQGRLAHSTDHGVTWTRAGWDYGTSTSSAVNSATFLNFGQDYAGARDNYVYSYLIRSKADGEDFDVVKTDALGNPNSNGTGKIDLARTPKDQILNKSAYEYFIGTNEDGDPLWSSTLSARQPVFTDPNGVGWNVSVSYNAGLGRYLLMTEHDSGGVDRFTGNLGLFESESPWGPWKTIEYVENDNWGGFGSTFFWNFSNKWTSADGLDTAVIFTGTNSRGSNDSWNSLEAHFQLALAPADFNQDGKVDEIDRGKWESGFGTSNGAEHDQGDADRDGDIDGRDFLAWQTGFSGSEVGSSAGVVVPEPTTGLLVVAAMTLMAFVRRT